MAAGAVAETVAVELEQVAGDIEQVASITRNLDKRVLGSLFIGVAAGAGLGLYFGYKYSKKKLRHEIYAEAEADIDQIRTHYAKKILALEEQNTSASVEEIVKERGYVTEEEVVQRSHPVVEEEPEPVKLPEPPAVEATKRNVFQSATSSKDKDEDWDYTAEIDRRGESEAYVIHQDEFDLHESGFAQLNYEYYVLDDKLIDTDDIQSPLHNRDELIGEDTLNKFGHGSDDWNKVYARNVLMELEFEIDRLAKSWEEEVMGLDPNDPA